MAVRWERAELARSRERGIWDRWGVHDVERRGEWFVFQFGHRRIYAPLEHPELASQFARLAGAEKAMLPFFQTYGRLGWSEISAAEGRNQGSAKWFRDAQRELQALIDDHGAVYAEPVEWIRAHAATVKWCLAAGHALRIEDPRARRRECRRLSATLPTPGGFRRSLGVPLIREHTIAKVSALDFVGGMLVDYLWINLEGVRRRVDYANGRIRSLWGGDSLLESIYAAVTDAVTGGRLKQCEAPDCGAVFIQTDERQRFCPPREGQTKSTCMNRLRVQRHREKGRS